MRSWGNQNLYKKTELNKIILLLDIQWYTFEYKYKVEHSFNKNQDEIHKELKEEKKS